MLRTYIRLLRFDPRWRRLGVPLLLVAVVSIAIGVTLSAFLRSSGDAVDRARRLAAMGELAAAEELYWQAIQAGSDDLETLISFIDLHAVVQEHSPEELALLPATAVGSQVDGHEVEAFLAGGALPEPAATLARFWWHASAGPGATDPAAVLTLADAEPPARWANHLLGRLALMEGDHGAAAERFAREGVSFPEEAADDLERALSLWMATGQWHEVRERLDEPKWTAAISARIRLAVAEHDRDWPSLLLWLWPASLGGGQAWPWALALVSAVLWFLLAARMGVVSDRKPGRKALYVSAFALGVVSVYPTLVAVVIEETLFDLSPDGQPIVDAIYYVFGVGLREELCKLLLFLPLLPLLRRRRSRLEAMVCGALVGLGFAAEENIGYFHSMDVGTALARFLTANFLHMALTALIATAVYDGSSARKGEDFATVFPLAVLLHGAYDFFLASPVVAMEYSFLAMTVFVFLSQRFLRELKVVRPTRRGSGLLRQFVISLAVLAGVSYIYACTLIGPLMAFPLIGSGLLGLAILLIMFVRELEGT
jgi:RsiW-degrading membrane proteinase PrsW (M82 family)